MTEALAALLGLTQTGLAAGVAVFLRVGAAMAILPAFGERSVPVRVRLALTLAFTAVVLPAAAPVLMPVTGVDWPGARLVATEVLAGLMIGLGLRLFVIALQTAGAIAAQATSLAQLFGGAAADPQPAIAHLMVVAGLALAVMAGLHVKAAQLFVLSYALFPPGVMPGAGAVAAWGSGQIADAFALAFVLAAPFVIGSLIYNLALGVINRAMPQLMVAFVGAPAITAGALLLLFLTLPLMLTVWSDALDRFIAAPAGGR